jgi:putative hydrolase of the HAD superfamily
MLTELRGRYHLGLLTNGPVVAQRSKLDALGWADAFDVALVTGELAAGKPEPAAFESLLSELGTDASATVFVGNDVTADVQGAVAAGIDAVQVCYADGPPRDPDAFAHIERDHLAAELPRVLAER